MPPRNASRPLGRADHEQRVAAVEAEIDKLLKGIAADPDAGPWAAWAKKLLNNDEATPPTRSGERPGGVE